VLLGWANQNERRHVSLFEEKQTNETMREEPKRPDDRQRDRQTCVL
jgi:hypothetical protein